MSTLSPKEQTIILKRINELLTSFRSLLDLLETDVKKSNKRKVNNKKEAGKK